MIYSASVKTDARGRFEIDGIEPGAYDIEVSDPSAGSGQGYAILLSCSVAKSDTMNLGTDTLRPYAFGTRHGRHDRNVRQKTFCPGRRP